MGIMSGLSKQGKKYNKNYIDRNGLYLVEILDGAVVKTMRKRNDNGEPCKRFNPNLKIIEVLGGGDDSHAVNELVSLPLFENASLPMYFQRDLAALTETLGSALDKYDAGVAAELDGDEYDEYMDELCEELFCSDGEEVKGVPFLIQVSDKISDKTGKRFAEFLFKPV